jgi:hypothetical protein
VAVELPHAHRQNRRDVDASWFDLPEISIKSGRPVLSAQRTRQSAHESFLNFYFQYSIMLRIELSSADILPFFFCRRHS